MEPQMFLFLFSLGTFWNSKGQILNFSCLPVVALCSPKMKPAMFALGKITPGPWGKKWLGITQRIFPFLWRKHVRYALVQVLRQQPEYQKYYEAKGPDKGMGRERALAGNPGYCSSDASHRGTCMNIPLGLQVEKWVILVYLCTSS